MKKKEYGVFGLGKFGMAVALRLAEAGNSVVAVDSDPDRIDEIANSVTCAMVADIADPDVLENLGISNLDCVVVGVSTDMQASIRRRSLRKKKGCLSLFQKRKMRCTSTFWKKSVRTRSYFRKPRWRPCRQKSDGRRLCGSGRTLQRVQHGRDAGAGRDGLERAFGNWMSAEPTD